VPGPPLLAPAGTGEPHRGLRRRPGATSSATIAEDAPVFEPCQGVLHACATRAVASPVFINELKSPATDSAGAIASRSFPPSEQDLSLDDPPARRLGTPTTQSGQAGAGWPELTNMSTWTRRVSMKTDA